MDERIGFGLYQSCGYRRSVGRVSVLGLLSCGWCAGVWGVGMSLELGSGWVMLCLCEMAGPGICTLCYADTYAS